MGCDTVFSNTVHVEGPDLDLKRRPSRSDQSRVERLVHILLRHRNIVFEPTRNRFVHLMDDTQRRIAVLDRIHNNADCKQIIDLIDGLALVDHLLID